MKMFQSTLHVILRRGPKNPVRSMGPLASAQGDSAYVLDGGALSGVKHLRFRRLFCVFVLICFCAPFVSGTAFARQKPKTHFLSWESLRRPEEYRRMMRTTPSPRRFKVTRERVAFLKKTSFWNRRPYQFASPVVDGGKIFVGVDAGRFYSIDARMEEVLWEFKPEGPVHGKAAVSDGAVYFGDTKAFVYALDSETGQEKWRARLDTEILAAPLVAGDRVFVTDMSGRLYALDKNSGVEAWHTNPNDKNIGFSVRRSAAPVQTGGGLILSGSPSGLVVAYRASDGQIAWVRQLGDRQSRIYDVDSAPLVVGDKAYVASADGGTFCLESGTGRVVWSQGAGGANDIILHDGKIYASGGGVLSALDPETGDIFWQQDLETPEVSSPVAGEHHIGVVSTLDKFYVIDTETGDIGYDRYVGKGAFGDPVISGDFLYILSNKGKLYSFKIRELPPKKQRKK